MSEIPEAKRLLKEGILLETTMSLAYEAANKSDFASRFAREFGLLLMGQAIKFFDITGMKDRAYSHLGIYADPGMGKDFCWKIIETSGIFPSDVVRVTRLDKITSAALVGTISERQIVPPPVITEQMIFSGEFSTLKKKNEAEEISADLRVLLETGEYKRRLAKVVGLKEALLDPRFRENLQNQMEQCKKLGMTLDLDKGEIHVRSAASWIISSARFGSGTIAGRPLLNMGDLDRFRWLSFLPDPEEREKLVAEVGSLPPVVLNESLVKATAEAWRSLFVTIEKLTKKGGLQIIRDEISYQARKQAWEETVQEIKTHYPDMTEQGERILINLRTHAEFNRVMHQYAATQQFKRAASRGLPEPSEFIMDSGEDGAFARQLFIHEYVPGVLDLIEDVLHTQPKRYKRVYLTEIGEKTILEGLQNGPKSREDFIEPIKKAGISVPSLDCLILPRLIQKRLVCKPRHSLYMLKRDCATCPSRESCRTIN